MSALHRLIHGGFKQLGISDEADRRAIYVRVVAKDNLTDMSDGEMQAVADELRHLGYRPATGGGTAKGLAGKYAKKLQALWIAGWNLGIVRDRRDAALIAFVQRQTGLDHVRFLHHADDGRAAIEALKGWLHREAGVEWSVRRYMSSEEKADGYRIAYAQWKMLTESAGSSTSGFWQEVHGAPGITLNDKGDVGDRAWINVMNHLGKRVRAVKGGA